MKIRDLFVAHAAECKKGNKCCYSVENGSTQESIAALEALQRERVIAELEALLPKGEIWPYKTDGERELIMRFANRVNIRIAALKAEGKA